jgi:uncharacterized protein YjiS (DUF1127 family)
VQQIRLPLEQGLNEMNTQSETDLLARFLDTVATWQQRSRDRHLLAQMNERQRCDIGLSPETIDIESSKPFWRA